MVGVAMNTVGIRYLLLLTSLSVDVNGALVTAVVKNYSSEVISSFSATELIPLCLRAIETGSELFNS